MLNKGLERIINSVDGAIGIVLLGLDGLPIAEVSKNDELDISVLGAELTTLYKNAIKLTEDMRFGSLEEVSVSAESAVVLCRAITEEYFLLLAMKPEAIFGKGRYQLRRSVDEFKKQLI